MSALPFDPALLTPGPTAPVARARSPLGDRGLSAPSFGEVLALRDSGRLQFSRHALARLQRRGIELGPPALARLESGVELAAGKGARESLVLVDDAAFVVSVSSRTVITAVNREPAREQVFTNIDSAVIA